MSIHPAQPNAVWDGGQSWARAGAVGLRVSNRRDLSPEAGSCGNWRKNPISEEGVWLDLVDRGWEERVDRLGGETSASNLA